MPHNYKFDPPARGNRGGPLLKLIIPDPRLEQLADRRIVGKETPYATNTRVENLLDEISFGVRPSDLDQVILLLALGLAPKKAGTTFELSPTHIHATDEVMRPTVLLDHSSNETGNKVVKIASLEELGLLSVALIRELGYRGYLSTVQATNGSYLSGVAICESERVSNFVLIGNHPSIVGLTIFEDYEVTHLLELLRAHNSLRRLRTDLKRPKPLGEVSDRYERIRKQFAEGCLSGHNFANLVYEQIMALAEMVPAHKTEKPS